MGTQVPIFIVITQSLASLPREAVESARFARSKNKTPLSFTLERTANPLRFRRQPVVEQDGVESARPIPIRASGPDKPPFCGENDAPPLGRGDRLRRATEAGIRAQTHFDENQGVALQADQIEFSAPATHVAGEDFESSSGQPRTGMFLCQLSARLR